MTTSPTIELFCTSGTSPTLELFCTSGTSPTRLPDAPDAPEFTLTGPPDDIDAPIVLVLGGISAGAEPDWWPEQIGPDRPLDTNRFRILSIAFDGLSTDEQAERLCTLLDTLGIAHLHAAVGCSYGGMVALAFAAKYPNRVGRLAIVGAAHRPHRLAHGWRLIQRRILALGEQAGDPEAGVALARMLAMTTYRSDRELDARFDAESLTSWLDHHGDRYADSVSTERYHRLSAAIDDHAIAPETVVTPTTLIGFDSDQLVPPWLLNECAESLAAPTNLHILPSKYGHDAFLIEHEALAPLLRRALEVAA